MFSAFFGRWFSVWSRKYGRGVMRMLYTPLTTQGRRNQHAYSPELPDVGFWTIHVGRQQHLYCLKAPRTGHASTGHDFSVIAHATSSDLVHLQWHENALYPGAAGAWDDLCLLTGSVIAHRNQ